MRTIIILQLIIIPLLGFGQDWAPIGAKWYYDHFDGIQPYLTTIESIKDTVVLDKDCKILETNSICEIMNQDGTYYWDTLFVSRDFLYYNQDTIFHFYDNEFYPLYIFNLNLNDTVLVRPGFDCEQPDYYCYRFEYVVDSIKTIVISGQDLKLIYNSLTDESNWAFNLSWNYETRPIIEKIGSTKFLFGISRNAVLEGDINCLRCYIDNTLTYKADYWTKDCDYLRSLNGPSLVQINETIDILVSPNPFSSYIEITNDKSLMKYELFDSFGRLLIQGNDKMIKTESLTEGIYFLKLTSNKNEIKTIKITKHLP